MFGLYFARAVRVAIVCCNFIILVPIANSQNQAEQNSAQLGRFAVTGSHIPRLDLEGTTPVLRITREDLKRTGVMTVGEVLQQLPIDNGGTFNDRLNGGFAQGGSGVSLRGLGVNTVLVLINGRRATNYGFADLGASFNAFVDLNSIPIGLVERIEVLKDGASAIYGSDAIAGVINMILREDFEGGEVEARYGQAEDPGAEEVMVNAVFGAVSARSSATLMASYTSRDEMFLRDRATSRSADFIAQGGADLRSIRAANDFFFFALPGDGCDRPNMVIDPDFFETCLYDYNAHISLPGARRTSLTGLFRQELSADLEFRAELGYMNAISDTTSAPSTIDDGDDLLAPVSNPWNVGGVDFFNFFYRLEDVGPRLNDVETDNVRAVFELSGLAFDGAWNWELGALYNRAVTTDNQENYVNKLRMQLALNGLLDVNGDGAITMNEHYNIWTPVTNPIDPALSAALRARPFRRAETELRSFDGNLSGPIADLPAGPLSLAVGFEARDELLVDRSDSDSEANLILGSGGVSSEGSRSQTSIYAELAIPISDTLEAQVAARYEDYDGFGSETNPKLAAMWRPLDWLLVRGSWGEGFRAPSLAELFLGSAISFLRYDDQIRCPVTGTNLDCGALDRQLDTLGNALLGPETSESYSLGVVVNVPMVENLTVGLNYWNFEHDDRISDIDVFEILGREADCFNGLPTCDAGLAALVSRSAPTPADMLLGLPGSISTVTSSPQNISEQMTDGYDLEVRYMKDTPNWGSFRVTTYVTYVDGYEFRLRSVDPRQQRAGQYLRPELRATTDLSWTYDDFQIGLFNRYIGSYEQLESAADFNSFFHADIGSTTIASHNEWDLRLDYTGFPLFTITVGVENFTDEETPLDWDAIEGYNTGFYDGRGRFIYTQVGLQF